MNHVKLWVTAMEVGRLSGCHQLPERSLHLGSYQFPLCARCTGICIGQLLSCILPFPRTKRLRCSAALLLPMAIDGLTQLIGVQKSTNRRRLATGILGGIGYALILRTVICRLKNRKP